jgi:transposase-like protein
MTRPGDNLTGKQAATVAALLSESSIEAAAKRAGVSAPTLFRWLRLDRDFVAAYRAARSAVVETAVAGLQRVTTEAVKALRKALTCGNTGVEVRAALGILDHALRGVEVLDLAEQVEELQRRIAALQQAKEDR